MKADFGLNLRKKLEELQLPKPDWYKEWPLPIKGCTLNQIIIAKNWQCVERLPLMYEQFLLEMGQSPGDLFLGFDVAFHHLENLKDYANQCLRENNLTIQLPNDAFVFMSQQGHSYWYFLTANRDDDPPVYRYTDDDGEPENPYKTGPIKEWNHLSTLLTLFIAEREGKEAQENFLSQYL